MTQTGTYEGSGDFACGDRGGSEVDRGGWRAQGGKGGAVGESEGEVDAVGMEAVTVEDGVKGKGAEEVRYLDHVRRIENIECE